MRKIIVRNERGIIFCSAVNQEVAGGNWREWTLSGTHSIHYTDISCTTDGTMWLVGIMAVWHYGWLALQLACTTDGWRYGWLALQMVGTTAGWHYGWLALWLVSTTNGWSTAGWRYGWLELRLACNTADWHYDWLALQLVGIIGHR